MESDLRLRDNVRIRRWRVEGEVNAVMQNRQGFQYNIEYLNDSKQICSRWFVFDELELIISGE